jgi:hypothetical protein
MYLSVRSPANLGAYVRGVRSPANLGFFRPNQSFDRGLYGLGCAGCKDPRMRGRDRKRGGLGDDTNLLPGGSKLSYTASWGNSFTSWNDPNGIQSSIQGVLANQWGIVIDSQFHTSNDTINWSGKSGFTLQVHTTRDYGAPADVKSIIDGALYNLGVTGLASQISVTSAGVSSSPSGALLAPSDAASAALLAQYQAAVAAGDIQGSAQLLKLYQASTGAAVSIVTDPLTWLGNNWQWVAIGASAFFIVPRLLKL